ncbi:MAG: shikimate dehydrogenase [Bacteroidales bacterium]|nr:shikimate dehydrogenase [Bacteroidales bacterium]
MNNEYIEFPSREWLPQHPDKNFFHEYGIIGKHLTHSLSPALFSQIFKENGLLRYDYQLFSLESIEQLHILLKQHPFLDGFNVTSPYKKEIISHLHALSPEAEQVGAVNVVKVTRGQSTTFLTGYNTDTSAFAEAFDEVWGHNFSSALIFGNGGAAAAAAYALRQWKIPYTILCRSGKDHAPRDTGMTSLWGISNLSDLIANTPLLIHATPVGMFPRIRERLHLPYEAIGQQHFLMDMIYNPPCTDFLAEGKKRGARVLNGQRMFELQAKKSWDIWKDDHV